MGALIEWLVDRMEIAGVTLAGPWFDIGSPEQWRAAERWCRDREPVRA